MVALGDVLAGVLTGSSSNSSNGQWQSMSGNPSDVTQGQSTGGGIQFFQPDLFPTSQSSQSTSSSSRSGINWNSPFMQALLPQLNNSLNQLPSTLDNMQRTLQDQQTNLARQSLGPQALQGTLNNLAANGMINSSVAGDALSKTASTIMQDVLNRGYESALAGQQARLALPSALAGVAQLGQESSSSSRSSASSSSSNPLAPYELAASILQGTF